MICKNVGKKFISINEASKSIGVSQQILINWMKNGKIKGFVITSGIYEIKEDYCISVKSLEKICKLENRNKKF